MSYSGEQTQEVYFKRRREMLNWAKENEEYWDQKNWHTCLYKTELDGRVCEICRPNEGYNPDNLG